MRALILEKIKKTILDSLSKKITKLKESISTRWVVSFYKMGSHVKLAQTKEEKEAIFRFRFEVYNNELGRVVPGNYSNGMIHDEFDDSENCKIFYIGSVDKVLATARVLLFEKDKTPEFIIKDYSLGLFDNITNNKISVMERFMVRKDLRGGVG